MIEATDPIEQLRQFRSAVEPPTAGETEAAVAALRRRRSKRRRSRFVVFSAASAAVAAAAVGVVAAAPWHGKAEEPSATYKPGWILHRTSIAIAVPYPGARHFARLVEEDWQETALPYQSRRVGYAAWWVGRRVETGTRSAGGGSMTLAYDPHSRTLYERRSRAAAAPPVDAAAYAKRQLADGAWKIAARETDNGRELLKVANAVPGVTYYLDAKTYTLVKLVGPGFPLGGPKVTPPCTFSGKNTKTVVHFKIEYLPPTRANKKLADIAAQHPDAQRRPVSAMPTGFRQIVSPAGCNLHPQSH